MFAKLSYRITAVLIMVLVVIMTGFTIYLVAARSEVMEAELLDRGTITARAGARIMEEILEDSIADRHFTVAEVFDESYRPIPNTFPQKYTTAYDGYLDKKILRFQDELLLDEQAVFAALVDRNGYLPTHNSKYSKPLTGDREKDLLQNRTKRIFNDEVGLAAARNSAPVLKQVYRRDTGETMWDISAPVFVKGKQWGAFRIGYSMERIAAKKAVLRQQLFIALGILLVITSATVYLVVLRSTRPLLRLTSAARRIAEGKLDEQVIVETRDEIGQLAEAFNTMTSVIVMNLRKEVERSGYLITSIKDAVEQLSESAEIVMGINCQQADEAYVQAASVEQVSATAEGIAGSARMITDSAQAVSELAAEANQSCSDGSSDMHNATDAMARLKAQVEGVAASMLQLGEKSQTIGGIVELIDDISSQTNLLSLNAAIEAAGAGEAGRRFGVVAQEVKRLAQRTTAATEQIRALITEIQKTTNATVMVTEEGLKRVETTGLLLDKARLSLDAILETVKDTAQASLDITTTTKEQTQACQQLASAMLMIRSTAQKVAQNSEGASHAFNQVLEQVEKLRGMTGEDS